MRLREAMETSRAGTGPGTGRKKLKHRLAAILSAFSRRAGGARKRRDSEEEVEATPVAFPSYSRFGVGNGSSRKSGGMFEPRRYSVSAPRPTPRVHITIDCAGRRSVDAADPSVLPPLDADAASRKTRLTGTGPPTSGEWEGRKCPPSSPFVALLPPPPPPAVARWRERERANNGSSTSSRPRLSTHSSRRLAWSSSSDDEYEYEYDEEEDSRNNLFSSRSFSSDSCSNLYNNDRPRGNAKAQAQARASISGPCRAPPLPHASRRGASRSCRYSFELPRGTRSDAGFAVVKRSADPYEDFRRSMREMIAEWPKAGGGGETERLLETYLVLNSPRHYPAILAAFADVRETLFP